MQYLSCVPCSVTTSGGDLYVKTPNALGVKLRLAATEAHTATPPPTARCPLQLLVGLPAYRLGPTRFTPRTLWRLSRVSPRSAGLRPAGAVRSRASTRVGDAPAASHNRPSEAHRPPRGRRQAHHALLDLFPPLGVCRSQAAPSLART